MISLSSALAWVRQPTTIIGLGTIIGAAVGLATHDVSISTAIPLIAGGLVGVAIPENTALRSDVQQTATDVIAAVGAKGSPASIATVTADLVRTAGELPDATPVVAVQAVAPVTPSYQVVHPALVAPAPVLAAASAPLVPAAANGA